MVKYHAEIRRVPAGPANHYDIRIVTDDGEVVWTERTDYGRDRALWMADSKRHMLQLEHDTPWETVEPDWTVGEVQ